MVPRPPDVIQRFGSLETRMLRRPHLMLADFGRDVGVAILRRRIKPLDRILRLDDLVGIFIGERFALARHWSICSHHFCERLGIRTCSLRSLPEREHLAQRTLRAIADDAEIDACTFLLIDDGSMSM